MRTSDFTVIGGGIIGLSIARELQKLYPGQRICLIEKEEECGTHASGRNSGVLHAGFYYTADSLKAKFTRVGNQMLTQYCEEKKIPLNKCGKLVVAKDEHDLAGLEELKRRAEANSVVLHELTENEAKQIEPRVKTFKRALFSPTTSSVNPSDVLRSIKNDALAEGIEIFTGTKYLKKTAEGILTTSGLISSGYFVNAAGLYADKIALDFGFSQNYRILPFKGLYLYSNEPVGALRTHIYPVPDLNYPFLGVHFTLTADGHIKIGPTAIPAFWREQYSAHKRFNTFELLDILSRQIALFFSSGFDFKKLAVQELQKYSKTKMAALASHLLEGVGPIHTLKWGKPGIRAQLLDIKKRKLEMDFVFEGDRHSFHVLNAVSPGFTCAPAFSQYVCSKIAAILGG